MLPNLFENQGALRHYFVFPVFLFHYWKELLLQIYRGTHMLKIKLVTIIRLQNLIVRAFTGTVFLSFSVLLDKNLTVALHGKPV